MEKLYQYKEVSMEIKTFNRGIVIFREGDPGDCMYDVYSGKVGIPAAKDLV